VAAVVATEKEVITLLVEIPTGNVLTLLRVSAERTSTVGKIILLPLELLQVF
jgi:hypothetical protein